MYVCALFFCLSHILLNWRDVLCNLTGILSLWVLCICKCCAMEESDMEIPQVGTRFRNLDESCLFWVEYGRVGFHVRKRNTNLLSLLDK